MGQRRTTVLLAAVAALTVSCSQSSASSLPLPRSEDTDAVSSSEGPEARSPSGAAGGGTSTTSTTSTTTSSTTTTSTTSTTTSSTTTAPGRVEMATGYGVLADADGVTVVYPAAAVEMVGFHESGHDGSKAMRLVDSTASASTLESRDRGTDPRSAADIVVAPDTEIRAPVTGTVIRGGSYVLYCDHTDDFVVIEPDERPGWEVKMFHFSGLQLGIGERVDAGVTVVAPRAAVLPFESQVDELSAEPSWPHVHVEVIDPRIPDRPSSGGGC